MKVLVISFQSLDQESAGGTGRIAYHVAEKLHEQGFLKKLVVSSKGKFTTTFPSVPVSWFSRYYLFILNRFLVRWGLPQYVKRYIEEILFDFLCLRHVTSDVSVIFSSNAYLKRTLAKAKKQNIKTHFFPGNPSEHLISKLMTDEYKKLGQNFLDAYSYKPRFRYYHQSLLRYSTFIIRNAVISKSFKSDFAGIEQSFISGLVPPLALDRSPKMPTSGSKFTVGYLAYSVPLKGLHYLLEAWIKTGNASAKLIIGGPLDHAYEKFVRRRFDITGLDVEFIGLVTDRKSFYQHLSLFVAPSIIDGEPVTALEAMQVDVPVIITDGCGIRDFITDRTNGFIVPVGDPLALAETIQYCFQNTEILDTVGKKGGDFMRTYSLERFIVALTDKITQS